MTTPTPATIGDTAASQLRKAATRLEDAAAPTTPWDTRQDALMAEVGELQDVASETAEALRVLADDLADSDN